MVNRSLRIILLFALCTLLLATAPVSVAQKGRLLREKVHGVSLENNPAGESADRSVAIYLPPSYDTSPEKRYPVIYILHGIQDTEEQWIKAWRAGDPWGTVQDLMDQGIAAGSLAEMIVVIPNELTRMGGSFYTNSAATGNWEDFTVRDLVQYVDGKYRTLARAASRGLLGHSMGGYGAIKLGMKHPDVFSAVYALSPAALGWAGDLHATNHAFFDVQKIKSPEDITKYGFYPAAILCLAQAFSPNPQKPPFFADLPFAVVNGGQQPAEPAYSHWEENFPLNMARSYRANLMKLRFIRFDAGYADEFSHIPLTAKAFSLELTNLDVPHRYEEYNGDHRNRLWGRSGRIMGAFAYFSFLLEK